MNTSLAVPNRATLGRCLVFAVALVLGFAVHNSVAADAAPVPVSVSFEKVEGDEGPYVATVTNTSSAAIAVQISVHQSVKSHNRPMDINNPEESVAAGGSTAVKGLAAHDKLKISAEGYAPVEIVVPGSK